MVTGAANNGTDVIAGLFQGSYNGVALSDVDVHAIVEDRGCIVTHPTPTPAVCLFHPWGSDTVIAVYPPVTTASAAPTTYSVDVYSRRGVLLSTLGPLAVQGDGLLMVNWQRLAWKDDGRDYAWLYAIHADTV